jgi:aminopeptidase N
MNLFLRETDSALAKDQSASTHKIAADVKSTGVATDNFDGISYGKGACWLR